MNFIYFYDFQNIINMLKIPQQQITHNNIPQILSQKQVIKSKIKYFFTSIIILLFCYAIFRFIVPDYSMRRNVTMEYKIPIVYIWLGGKMPSRYEHRLKWLTFPYILIGQKQWQQLGTQFHHLQLNPIYRGDILRLLYLYQNPGVYSDLDNILDYNCLMRMLPRKKGFYMAAQPMHHYPYASNLLLFVDNKHDPTIKNVLKAIKSKLESADMKGHIFQLTGPQIVYQNGVKTLDDIYLCQNHESRQDIV